MDTPILSDRQMTLTLKPYAEQLLEHYDDSEELQNATDAVIERLIGEEPDVPMSDEKWGEWNERRGALMHAGIADLVAAEMGRRTMQMVERSEARALRNLARLDLSMKGGGRKRRTAA